MCHKDKCKPMTGHKLIFQIQQDFARVSSQHELLFMLCRNKNMCDLDKIQPVGFHLSICTFTLVLMAHIMLLNANILIIAHHRLNYFIFLMLKLLRNTKNKYMQNTLRDLGLFSKIGGLCRKPSTIHIPNTWVLQQPRTKTQVRNTFYFFVFIL